MIRRIQAAGATVILQALSQKAEFPQNNGEAHDGETGAAQDHPQGLLPQPCLDFFHRPGGNQKGGLVRPLQNNVPVILIPGVGIFRACAGDVVGVARLQTVLSFQPLY